MQLTAFRPFPTSTAEASARAGRPDEARGLFGPPRRRSPAAEQLDKEEVLGKKRVRTNARRKALLRVQGMWWSSSL